jgi:hypothetical protein
MTICLAFLPNESINLLRLSFLDPYGTERVIACVLRKQDKMISTDKKMEFAMDVPTATGGSKCTPEGVRDAVLAAYGGRARRGPLTQLLGDEA